MAPKKIFIIDDADFMVDMLRVIISDAGYDIVGSAFNGEQAIDIMKSLPDLPDVVTLDFHMPKLNALETINRIRGLNSGVKIILISSDSTMPVVLQAKSAGVDAFIAKPFEPQTVLNTLAKLF